jgi:hypothetical protein
MIGLQPIQTIWEQVMNSNPTENQPVNGLILILGATGKTGRRIAAILKANGHEIRLGSRSATPSFD